MFEASEALQKMEGMKKIKSTLYLVLVTYICNTYTYFFLFSGPKFNLTSHKVEALIVEYDSNVTFSFSHDEMSQFYTSVNNWFSSVIKTAPPQLQSGFFLSHLGFYDVQNSLLQDTLMAIGLAMAVAIIVVFASTLNVGLTFLGKIF